MTADSRLPANRGGGRRPNSGLSRSSHFVGGGADGSYLHAEFLGGKGGRGGAYLGPEQRDTFGMHPWNNAAPGGGGGGGGPNAGLEDVLEETVFLLPGVDVRVKYHSAEADGVTSTTVSDPAIIVASAEKDEVSTTQAKETDSSSATTSTARPSSSDSSSRPPLTSNLSTASNLGGVSKRPVKKGKLFVSCHFQKLPDEMSISPALVDFLTQVRP